MRLTGLLNAASHEALGAGISSNLQVGSLIAIAQQRGICPSELADRMGVLPPSISRVVRTLTTAGLVESETRPDDARRRHLRLTRRGAGRLARLYAALVALSGAAETREILELLRAEPPREVPALEEAAVTLVAAGRLVHDDTVDAVGAVGVPPDVHVYALATLCSVPETRRPSKLAEWLSVSRASSTGYLDRMEQEGLVQRRSMAGRADGRGVEIVPTDRGQRVAATVVGVFERHARTMGEAIAALAALDGPELPTPEQADARPTSDLEAGPSSPDHVS